MILVTGGTGFLGQVVVRTLRKRGHAVVAPTHANFDLTQPDAARAMLATCHPETVVHLAARVGGIGANRAHPAEFFYTNLVMGLQLMHAAWGSGVRKFVQVGTICSYPCHANVPFREGELWDGYPEPTNAPYGLAKKALLVMAQAYRAQYNFNAIYLLPTNLYGPGDNFDLEAGHVIPAMIRKMIEAKRSGAGELILWGDGTPTREFLYVDDAARGIALATEHYNKGEPVNLGSGDEVSIACLAEMVRNEVGYGGTIIWDKDKPNGQPRRKVSTARAKREFNFQAHVPLTEGLKRTISWYLTPREGSWKL